MIYTVTLALFSVKMYFLHNLADPGILDGAPHVASGSRAKPWWGFWGQSHLKLLDFRDEGILSKKICYYRVVNLL